jgi:hypothetical protein
VTRWGVRRPEVEAPDVADAWVRAQGIWKTLAGSRPEVTLPSVIDVLDAAREAALRQRLSLGPAEWSSMARDLRAAAEPLCTLLEDLAAALDELVELIEEQARDTGATKRRSADAGEGGARGTRGDDRAEEAAPSAQTRAGRTAPAEAPTERRARRGVMP